MKEEKNNSVSKSKAPTKAVKAEPTPASASASVSAATGPVTEDEIRAVLMEKKQVTTQDLVSRFKARLKTKEVTFAIVFYSNSLFKKLYLWLRYLSFDFGVILWIFTGQECFC